MREERVQRDEKKGRQPKNNFLKKFLSIDVRIHHTQCNYNLFLKKNY